MIVATNLDHFTSLKVNESALIETIQNKWTNIKVPIFIYVDKKLKKAHGLHACRNIKDYVKLPKKVSSVLMSEVLNNKDNKNHFHRISLSYDFLKMARNGKCFAKEVSDWYIKESNNMFYTYLMFLLSHELQHADQTENGTKFKIDDYPQYKNFMFSDDHKEIDAEISSILSYEEMLKFYKEINGGTFD